MHAVFVLASLLTTVLFSLSVVFASRSAQVLGGQAANFARLSLAAAMLAVWAHTRGGGLAGPALGWFALSGVIGFGIGDVALFGALPRIGPRLTILLTQCLAAPIAALAEWLWLDTRAGWRELGCAALILGGVALALAPDRGFARSRRTFWIGVVCGVFAAAGQALGAVVSRKANAVNALAGLELDGATAAYQRILGGLVVTVIAFALTRRIASEAAPAGPDRWRRGVPLVVANALAGPGLGVACYQWALRTTESAIVLAVVATSPIVTALLTWGLDGDRPSRRSIAGAAIAVSGVVALNLAK